MKGLSGLFQKKNEAPKPPVTPSQPNFQNVPDWGIDFEEPITNDAPAPVVKPKGLLGVLTKPTQVQDSQGIKRPGEPIQGNSSKKMKYALIIFVFV